MNKLPKEYEGLDEVVLYESFKENAENMLARQSLPLSHPERPTWEEVSVPI